LQFNLYRYAAGKCNYQWVGDKYCDKACQTLDCGYDAGDCGTEKMTANMVSVEVQSNTTLIEVNATEPSLLLNLTALYPKGQITAASHSNEALVAAAAVSQKFAVLTVVFSANYDGNNASVVISLSGKGPDGANHDHEFTVVLVGEDDTWRVPEGEGEESAWPRGGGSKRDYGDGDGDGDGDGNGDGDGDGDPASYDPFRDGDENVKDGDGDGDEDGDEEEGGYDPDDGFGDGARVQQKNNILGNDDQGDQGGEDEGGDEGEEGEGEEEGDAEAEDARRLLEGAAGKLELHPGPGLGRLDDRRRHMTAISIADGREGSAGSEGSEGSTSTEADTSASTTTIGDILEHIVTRDADNRGGGGGGGDSSGDGSGDGGGGNGVGGARPRRRLLDVYGDSLKHVNALMDLEVGGCTSSRIQLTHSFASAWFQPLDLSNEKLLSKLCFFQCNLYRYIEFGVGSRRVPSHMPHLIDRHVVGLYKLNAVDPYSLKAPGFNP
jgi:hypothetical protein